MATQRLKISGITAGVAGEYFVAAELCKRGHIASITLRNTRGIDILASDANAIKTVGIQVKTRQGRGHNWVLHEKAEGIRAPNQFYVFVCLGPLNERPDFFVVPSCIVAGFIKESHRKWLKTPGRYGQAHNDTKMREFRDEREEYLERWDLLGL